jgi:D-alanine-D-alanine ligase
MSDSSVVLFGGSSSERRVSVASAQNVARTLPHAALWFIAERGSVHVVERAALLAHARPFERDFVPSAATWKDLPTALAQAPAGSVFFLAVHGGDGENGELQRELEQRKLAFTGSGSAASALAFDKARAKSVVSAHGLRVASASVLQGGAADALQVQLEQLFRSRGRLVAKPTADGSSVGLHHLVDEPSLARAAAAIAAAGVPYLVEDFVQGVELTVGVIDQDGETLSLPPSEIRLEAGRAFDFEGKYLGVGTREITPAEIPPALERAAREAALTAHRALGCYGYSRTDLIASDGAVTFLETNTLPGLTASSFIPQQLAADGRSLERFVQDQLALAIARRDRA